MQCVLAAEAAILVHLESVGIVFLVLLCVIIALFAFAASKSNFHSHVFGTSCKIWVIPILSADGKSGTYFVPPSAEYLIFADR